MAQAAELEELDQQPNARLDGGVIPTRGEVAPAPRGFGLALRQLEGQAGQTARNVQLWRCVSF